MADVNLKSLVAKLNPLCQRSLVEGAIGLCVSRTNYNVELEHWLMKLLEPAKYINAPTIADKKLYAKDLKSIICVDIAGK